MKWKIFFYILSFCGILIVVLWVFQTVYLDEFYKMIKKRELETAVSVLFQNLTDENGGEMIEAVAKKYDLNIGIYDTDGKEQQSFVSSPASPIKSLSEETCRLYYEKAKKEGGKTEITLKEWMDERKPEDAKEQPPDYQPNDMPRPQDPNETVSAGEQAEKKPYPDEEWAFPRGKRNHAETLLSVRLYQSEDEERVVIFSSMLTPLNATVSTLRVQLLCISVFMIVLSLVLALVIAKRLTRSIVKVNHSAKELAEGNFEAEFSGTDYREISELSDTLNFAARELQKTEKLQRELIANVSHDLRTPLTMIIAYGEIMQDLPGETTAENIQVIVEEARRLTNLVNDMLDISKLQSGVMALDKQVYNLTDSIESVLERYSKLKEQDGYRIVFETENTVFTEADEFKIYQVLYNLVNNAVNYSGEEKCITVKQIVKDKVVRIEVCDTGDGIEEQELSNVWERYYKVDKVHKRAVMGTGLGLSIVKNILQLHKAAYGVISQKGVGSTFWFELPEADGEETE